jgi:hypothetical protein
MSRSSIISACAAVFAVGGLSVAVQAQQPPQFPNMTFFISGSPGPDGANLGGLDGADKHCQTLAARAGAGAKTWRAYLSTQAVDGQPAINARDRIGKGPWVNATGVQIASDIDALHDPDRNVINTDTGLTESGRKVPSRVFIVNQHDILTGSTTDGRAFPPGKDMTCGNWTKGGAEGSAMVGHHDRMGLRDDAASRSWVTAHPSRGCDMPSLRSSGGGGLIYCFAAN